MNPHLGTPDPQWAYMLLIRAELERSGRFVAEVDGRDAQARADIHWAARQAGRLLGVDVRIDLSAPFGHANSSVVATVRCVDSDGFQRCRAREGLARLLHSVRAVQDPSMAGSTVLTAPHPRTPQERLISAGD